MEQLREGSGGTLPSKFAIELYRTNSLKSVDDKKLSLELYLPLSNVVVILLLLALSISDGTNTSKCLCP